MLCHAVAVEEPRSRHERTPLARRAVVQRSPRRAPAAARARGSSRPPGRVHLRDARQRSAASARAARRGAAAGTSARNSRCGSRWPAARKSCSCACGSSGGETYGARGERLERRHERLAAARGSRRAAPARRPSRTTTRRRRGRSPPGLAQQLVHVRLRLTLDPQQPVRVVLERREIVLDCERRRAPAAGRESSVRPVGLWNVGST